MKFLKNLLAGLIKFSTGLGFYGIGLLGVAAALTFFFGWGTIPSGFVGAFIFKNWETIFPYLEKAWDYLEEKFLSIFK